MPSVFDLEKRVGVVEEEVVNLKLQVQRLSDGVATNNMQTGEMYQVFVNMRGGFAVIEWLGKIVKPVLYIGGFLTAGYIFLKTGVWGK